ncbi:MAG: polymer-forming cytoskeletal protein [Deltaproteobacteria bacterium]|nr:polymer-forming cytoskeletal protein [Deltaproteobacteria bacterium]
MAEQAERFVLGPGVTIVGDIDAGGSLRIEGSVRGRVFVRGTLEVAPGAVVEGFVQALEIDVWGRLSGVVRAAGEVRLRGDARISGDVEAPRVRFVTAEAPLAARAVAPVPEPRTPAAAPPPRPLPPPPAVPPSPADDEPLALPPAAAGQTPGVLPPWPPQGVPLTPPVWAPRSARPASVPPAPPGPPAALVPPEPETPVAFGGDASADGPPPSPPSITGGRRQIVVKRK